jgi:hypothetical protein
VADRARCGICGKSKPADQTTRVNGFRGGDFRRAPSRAMRRVCRDCTMERCRYVRTAQGEGRNVTLSEFRIDWRAAARAFGFDVDDLVGRR